MNPDPSKGRRRKSILVGLVGLILVVAGAFAFLQFMGAGKYSAGDLTTVDTDDYSLAYPSDWEDISNNDKLVKTVVDESNIFSDDIKAYAKNVRDNGEEAEAAVIVMSGPGVGSDELLQEELKNEETKKQLEESFKESFEEGSEEGAEGCEKLSNLQSEVKYNTTNFVVEVWVEMDCAPKEGSKGEPGHFVALIGLKNGKSYYVILAADRADWAKNGAFYKKDMLGRFEPK